ncbi:MAG: response regulator [Chloroflexota bacterium]
MLSKTAEPADILVVDDEDSVVEVVSLYLQHEGFHVRSANNGADALIAIQAEAPALVILDIMLPSIDGLTLIRRMRENPALDVPVIMLTARSQETDRIYGLELGADDYVTKPFSRRNWYPASRLFCGAHRARTVPRSRSSQSSMRTCGLIPSPGRSPLGIRKKN